MRLTPEQVLDLALPDLDPELAERFMQFGWTAIYGGGFHPAAAFAAYYQQAREQEIA